MPRVFENTTAGGLRSWGYKHEPALCAEEEDVTDGAEGGECAAGGVSVPHPPTPYPGPEVVRGAAKTAPLRQSAARRVPARPRHSANLHRISRHTRSTGITLKGWLRVSVFGVPEPKKRRGPARGGSGSGLDLHYSARLRPSPHHVEGLRCAEPHVLCFCEPAL